MLLKDQPCPRGSHIDNTTSENAPLLEGADDGANELQNAGDERSPCKYPYLIHSLREFRHAIVATWFSSATNWLLPLIPLAIASESLGWNSAVVFLLNFGAMLPLASLLSYSTEELSSNVGQTLGGLLNATFGNLVELIV